MVTGASTANLAVILIDARNGVVTQSRRHAYIASLVGIPHLVVAVNKMDLVGYSRDVFGDIREEFDGFAAGLHFRISSIFRSRRSRATWLWIAAKICRGMTGRHSWSCLRTSISIMI